MIRIKNISRKWGAFSIKNIDLKIKEEEYFVILGPTGAGKTLLLELLAGFYDPDRGDVFRCGKKITELAPQERGFSFVYQDYMLFPHMKVKENIAYGLKVNGKKDIDKKVRNIAETVGISHLLKRRPMNLSGGERQRVSIARALVMKPDVLLLDEPFGSVDYRTAKKLRSIMKKLHKKFDCTTIQVTHDQEEAMILGDRIAVMRDGKIEQVGPPEEIMRQPVSRFVADFVGTENIFHGRKCKEENGTLIELKEGDINIHTTKRVSGKVTVTMRPEDIILAEKKFESSARNVFTGDIKNITDRGNFHEVLIDIGLPLIAYVTKQSVEDLSLKKGKKIKVMFKASAVHVIKD